MPSVLAETLWQQARSRWSDVVRAWPDLEPAVALQQQLLRIQIDQTDRLESGGVIPPVLAPEHLVAKLRRGLPALRGERIPIPDFLVEALPNLCERLTGGEAPESARHLAEVLRRGQIDGRSLLAASLERNEAAIRMTSLQLGLSPNLVWLVGELGVAPLANVLQRRLLQGPESTKALAAWDRGYCPVCGSWPAFIEVVNGIRILRCSFCAAAWTMLAYRCIYCGDSAKGFIAAAPDTTRTDRRLELCASCGGYTKVIRAERLTPFPLIAIEDLASLDLDRGATERGYVRPKMIDFGSIEPSAAAGDCAGLSR